MSAITRLRKKWNYETDVPRCENCANYKKPGLFLRDSMPRKSPPGCKLGDFWTRPNAICDMWQGIDGSVIDKASAK